MQRFVQYRCVQAEARDLASPTGGTDSSLADPRYNAGLFILAHAVVEVALQRLGGARLRSAAREKLTAIDGFAANRDGLSVHAWLSNKPNRVQPEIRGVRFVAINEIPRVDIQHVADGGERVVPRTGERPLWPCLLLPPLQADFALRTAFVGCQ